MASFHYVKCSGKNNFKIKTQIPVFCDKHKNKIEKKLNPSPFLLNVSSPLIDEIQDQGCFLLFMQITEVAINFALIK